MAAERTRTRGLALWTCGLLALQSVVITAAQDAVPATASAPAPAVAPAYAPSPAAPACDGLATPGYQWLIVEFTVDLLDDSMSLSPQEYSELSMEAAASIIESAQLSTGLQWGILQDVIEGKNDTVLAATQLASPITASQQAALDLWYRISVTNTTVTGSHGGSPSPPPLLAAPSSAAGPPPEPAASAQGVLVHLNTYNVTSCIPRGFITLIRNAQSLTIDQVQGSNTAQQLRNNCTKTDGYYLLLDYVLSGIQKADAAALVPAPAPEQATGMPGSIATGDGLEGEIGAAPHEVLKSLWMDTQRRVAIMLAPYISSPMGPMWANGSLATFALPLDLSVGNVPRGLNNSIQAYAGNLTATAVPTLNQVVQCLPRFFNDTNDLSLVRLYDEQGCPLNATSQLVIPPLTNKPQWFANLNATLELINPNATPSEVREYYRQTNQLAVQLLSEIDDTGRANSTFVWPKRAVNDQYKAAGQISMVRPPTDATRADAATASAAYNNNSGQGFTWGAAEFSNVTFTPCSPFWFDYGYSLAQINSGSLVPLPPPAANVTSTSGIESGGGVPVAAIVVPVLAACLLAALLLAGFMWRRSRKRTGAGLQQHSAMLKGSAGLDDTWLIPYSDIRLMERLGEGGYGTVYKARWKETKVAVKSFSLPSSSQTSGAGSLSSPSAPSRMELDSKAAQSVASSLQKEAAIMSAIRHPNCIMYLGAVLEPPCLVMELASRGSLLEVLHKAKEPLPWPRRVAMAFDAAKGMQYLHSRQPPIIHRDLKSPNLLVDAHWQVKVSDFGLSRALQDQNSTTSSMNGPGNPRWLAPEVLKGDDSTAASDVYSFAIILWELLCQGQLPWEALGAWKIAAVVASGERPPVLPQEACSGFVAYDAYVQLMSDCWQQDPAARPVFDDICARLRAILDAVTRHAKSSRTELSRASSLTTRLQSLTSRRLSSEPLKNGDPV